MSKLLNFPMKKIKEESAEIFIPIEKKISKKLPVFYNPIMKLNRDITVLLLKQFPPKHICDPLAGTGIRSIRFAKELKYKSITVNDINSRAAALIKKNMKYNKLKFKIHNKEGNLMLLESSGFDFIDLDVFGSPNFILDSSVKRLSRDSILALTATDTSALSGTYPKACLRKYWASPLKNEIMHETGLRILIRKAQLIAAQYEKALTPIFSYSIEHYMRVFFLCKKSKKEVDKIIKQHGTLNNTGPLWLGQLWDKKLVEDMHKLLIKNIKKTKNKKSSQEPQEPNKELFKFMSIIKQESKISIIGFYNIHKIIKKYKIKNMPKKSELIKKIILRGYKASETHFDPVGIRSDICFTDLLKILTLN